LPLLHHTAAGKRNCQVRARAKQSGLRGDSTPASHKDDVKEGAPVECGIACDRSQLQTRIGRATTVTTRIPEHQLERVEARSEPLLGSNCWPAAAPAELYCYCWRWPNDTGPCQGSRALLLASPLFFCCSPGWQHPLNVCHCWTAADTGKGASEQQPAQLSSVSLARLTAPAAGALALLPVCAQRQSPPSHGFFPLAHASSGACCWRCPAWWMLCKAQLLRSCVMSKAPPTATAVAGANGRKRTAEPGLPCCDPNRSAASWPGTRSRQSADQSRAHRLRHIPEPSSPPAETRRAMVARPTLRGARRTRRPGAPAKERDSWEQASLQFDPASGAMQEQGGGSRCSSASAGVLMVEQRFVIVGRRFKSEITGPKFEQQTPLPPVVGVQHKHVAVRKRLAGQTRYSAPDTEETKL